MSSLFKFASILVAAMSIYLQEGAWDASHTALWVSLILANLSMFTR